MVLCHSVNAGSVVGQQWGAGDTQTPYAKECVWTFCCTDNLIEKKTISRAIDHTIATNSCKQNLKRFVGILKLAYLVVMYS